MLGRCASIRQLRNLDRQKIKPQSAVLRIQLRINFTLQMLPRL
jgi:hypothetical protein